MRFQNQSSEPKSHSTRGIIIVLGFVIVAITIIGIIITNLARGQTTTTGVYPAPVSTDSLSCTSTTYRYPFLTNTSEHATTKISLALGKSSIESISLTTTLTFDSIDEAEAARNFNQAAMNATFTKDHVDVGELNPVYSHKDRTFTLTLYASSKNLTAATSQYFALDSTTSRDYNQKSLSAHYAKLGFDCVANK